MAQVPNPFPGGDDMDPSRRIVRYIPDFRPVAAHVGSVAARLDLTPEIFHTEFYVEQIGPDEVKKSGLQDEDLVDLCLDVVSSDQDLSGVELDYKIVAGRNTDLCPTVSAQFADPFAKEGLRRRRVSLLEREANNIRSAMGLPHKRPSRSLPIHTIALITFDLAGDRHHTLADKVNSAKHSVALGGLVTI